MKRVWSVVIVAAVALLSAAPFVEAGPFAATDKFGYTGTITRFATLADAQANISPLGGPYAVPQRDAGIYFTDTDNIFLTGWWYTTDPSHGAYSGWGNPNNTNTGFVQLYDSDSSTDTSFDAYWDSSLKSFYMQAGGVDAGSADSARLWHAPNAGGASGLTAGTFVEWALNLQADFTEAALLQSPDFYVSTAHPTNVAGSFSGIFRNTSTLDASVNGYYRFNLSFNNTNWAYDNRQSLNGAFSGSEFGASAVPEPASMLLLGSGLAGLAARLRRKR